MGCTSSTEIVTDPVTGQVREKKKLGGSYPGNRPPQHAPYTPPAGDFHNGQATAHFISYGGGNALTLSTNNNHTHNNTYNDNTTNKPQFIQVTLPSGVHAGDKIHVQAPNGKLNEIIVPPGMGPGATFTVQFEDDPKHVEQQHQQDYYNPPLATATPETTTTTTTTIDNNNNTTNNSTHDDGFASGFNAQPSYPPPPRY
eukprot:CAMPEP_0116555460 /NCGR_PEP_ID=MMETSP0397-20121206/8161_1 /TAXON_ID=216820 /ORGANISM="Cyclophora tenuis, Strain ECT3854" /LENGTH=198 /DNA_ID=CAMNT_0004080737 /DNA_START=114 /DNA_END=710 /DNA_ORIENTATION=+